MQKVDPFSKPNLEDFYTLGAEIGSGAFSVVKKATRNEDGKEVAVKIINKFKHRHDLDLIRDEVAVMRAVRGHYHVVNLIDTFETDVFLYIIMELIVGGELFEKIVTKGYYSEADSAKIIRQIVKGVAFCHSKGVVHRDLKPENLLCANDEIESLSITDFGIAKLLLPGQKIRGSCGSPSYVSPEILLKQEYSYEVDMWAVGVISYILIAGYKPFDEEASSLPVHMQIINAEYEFPKAEWDEISDTAKDFIRRLLCKDVKSRMTAEQALQHPFIFEDAPLSNRSLNRTMEKLKEFNSTRKFKQAAFAIISGNRMKLTSLQQNTKELRLRPSKRNLLDGAVSPKDTKTEISAQPEQSSNDTVTERKSSARIITNLVSPKSPSNPSIVLEPPVEQVELVVVEKEDERDEDTEPSVALSINCAPDHMQGTAMIKEIRTIDVPVNGQVMLDSVPSHMISSSVHFHSFTDPTAVITKQRFSSEDNKSRLMWSLDTTKTGKHTVQIFYETKHMGWHASYTALLNDTETSIVLNGYYNIANYSGRSFTRPTVALVQDPEQFELDTPIDLTDHQEVKVPFARKLTFSVKTINMFKGSPFQDYEESLVFKQYAHNKAVTEPPRVNSVIMFLDDETKAIDFEILKSLPKGAMQVYQQISETHRHVTNTYVASLHITDGHQQYAHFEASTPVSQSAQSTQSGVSVKSTGPRLAALVEQLQGTNRKKDIVPSLPKLDKAPRGELTLGPVPFLQAKRVQKKFEVIHGDMVNESIQIRVKNTDAHATHTLMIEETMYRWREWKILFSNTAYSTPLVKENNKVHFTVEVKPGEERCVEYLVSYKNCLAM